MADADQRDVIPNPWHHENSSTSGSLVPADLVESGFQLATQQSMHNGCTQQGLQNLYSWVRIPPAPPFRNPLIWL